MMIVGGGGVALFFLYQAIKGNHNQAVNPSSQNQAGIDAASILDTVNQQQADNMNQIEGLIQQNQQDLQNQINDLTNKMGKTTTITATSPPPPPKKSTPTKQHKTTHHQPTPKKHVYVVKKGDTLSQIGEKTVGNYYHGGKQTLLKDNPGIKNPDKIKPGQKIYY